MKKLIVFLVAIFAFVVFAEAQRVYTLDTDTLTDATTVYSEAAVSSSPNGTITLQAVYTQISGTSAGTATFEASIDGTNYVTLAVVAGKYDFYPSASVTITNGATMTVVITASPFKYYRFKSVGTGTQSTDVSYAYLPKIR